MDSTRHPALRPLGDAAIAALLRDGEFPADILDAAPKVVVVLTQSWCPQWHDMARYLPEFLDRAAIFNLIYDLHPDFQAIMACKEDRLGNREVPYLRYYRQGRLIAATNWLPKATFAALLEREQPFSLR